MQRFYRNQSIPFLPYFFSLAKCFLILISVDIVASEQRDPSLFKKLLPEVQFILSDKDGLLQSNNRSKTQISQGLKVAQQKEHLPTIQYLYWLELRRLFKARDKDNYRLVLDEVELLPKSEDEFQVLLWIQTIAYYELNRDVNYLQEHLPLQEKIIDFYKQQNNRENFWLETINIAKYRRLLSQTTEAMNLLRSIENSVSNSRNNEVELAFYSEAGLNAYYQRNLDGAVEYFKKGLEIAKTKQDDGRSAATLYSHLAMTFSDIGRNDMAIDYFNKSHQQIITSKSENDLRIAKSLNNLAIAYQRDKQYDQAIIYNQKSFDLRKKINDKLGMAFSHTNMANIYRIQGGLRDSKNSLNQALELFDEVGYQEGASATLVELADLIIESGGVHDDVKPLLERSLSISIAANNRDTLLKIYNAYYLLFKNEARYQESIEYLEKYLNLYRELTDENTKKNLSAMQALYENEKQVKRISDLEQEKILTDVELEKEKYIRYFLLLGVFLVLLFTYFVYSRFRLKEKFSEQMLQKNSELTDAYKKLDKVARFDPLTSLYNRRAMSEYLKLELARIERNGKPLAIILCDIDFFKSFNDVHGHECGDFVLVKVAQLLNATLREQDLCCRWGGEEFLIMLPESDIACCSHVSERLRSILNRETFTFVENNQSIELKITMTFGCALYEPGKDIAETIQRADKALYKGKENGRNQVVIDC